MKKVDGIYPDGTKHRDNSILLPVFFFSRSTPLWHSECVMIVLGFRAGVFNFVGGFRYQFNEVENPVM